MSTTAANGAVLKASSAQTLMIVRHAMPPRVMSGTTAQTAPRLPTENASSAQTLTLLAQYIQVQAYRILQTRVWSGVKTAFSLPPTSQVPSASI